MTTKLAEITTNFKRFTENQVLTESHLNQIVDYFDDQIRLSRTALSGVGIVCGFKVSCDTTLGKINITQGSGITTDGDLFQLYRQNEGVTGRLIDFESEIYDAFVDYDNTEAGYERFFEGGSQLPNIYELLPQRRDDAGVINQELSDKEATVNLLSQFQSVTGIPLKDAVVLIYLENYLNEEDLCISLNCDNQGIDVVGNYRVLITSRATANEINDFDDTIQQTNYAQFYYQLPEVVLHKVLGKPAIFEDYSTLQNEFYEAIIKNNVVDKLYDGFDQLLDHMDAQTMRNEIKTRLTALFDFDESTIPEDFQYRYDLLKDLVATYNEIKLSLLQIEESTCHADVDAFPKHLMLGEVQKDGNCYEFRHLFYKSPILAGQTTDLCGSCALVELDYDLDDEEEVPCEEGGGTSGSGNHIVFVVDKSGSFTGQREFVKSAINGYLDSVADTNTYISLIGMLYGDIDVSENNVIHRLANDSDLRTWTNTFDAGGDSWGTGYQVVIDDIINTSVPDPTIVVVLADENPTGSGPIAISKGAIIRANTLLFHYIVDSNADNILSPTRAVVNLPPDIIASIDGETDLDTTDYFLTTDFSDLELKIKNLNESLINSNVLCPETTADEIVIDSSNLDFKVCYDPSKKVNYLYSLIKRVGQQLANYNPAYTFIRVTPSLQLGTLSKKAIPFYYNVGEKLIETWDFEKTMLGRHRTNISYHNALLAIKKPLEVCVDTDFYRIEGHHGVDYKAVVSSLKTIRKEEGLSFNVIALPISASYAKTLGTAANFTSYYLDRNPGLEHKAGVAPGGTFVVFYMDEIASIGEGGYEAVEGIESVVSKTELSDESSTESRILPVALASGITTLKKYQVVADFALPYLCCDDNNVGLSLPSSTVCFDGTTAPIPFDIIPKNGFVEAVVSDGQSGGVRLNDRGVFVFDPNTVSAELIGRPISFKVHNQEVDFKITAYRFPTATVTTTVAYDNDLKTKVTVTFKVTSANLGEITNYSWNFGDGDTGNNVPVSGDVKHTYDSPVNDLNTISPTLKISGPGACDVDIPIESITFDDPIEALLDLEVNKVCIDKTQSNPLHIALLIDESGSIGSPPQEIVDIKEGLTNFINDQENSGNKISFINMRETDDGIPERVIEEKAIDSTSKGEFIKWIADYRNGSVANGADHWSSSIGYMVNDLPGITNGLTTNPDITIIITDGLGTNDISRLKTRIVALSSISPVFYYGLSTGGYSGGSNLVSALTNLLGRTPILSAPDFSDIDTTDYFSFTEFGQLGTFLTGLKDVLDNTIGSVEKVKILEVLPSDGVVAPVGNYPGLTIQPNQISINPNTFEAIGQTIRFTVNGFQVPEVLVVNEGKKAEFDFSFDPVEVDIYGSDNAPADGQIFRHTVFFTLENLNEFDESAFTYLWTFENVSTLESTAKEPQRTYDVPYKAGGTYETKVILTVTGDCESKTIERIIEFEMDSWDD